jgi:hypothetical protein
MGPGSFPNPGEVARRTFGAPPWLTVPCTCAESRLFLNPEGARGRVRGCSQHRSENVPLAQARGSDRPVKRLLKPAPVEGGWAPFVHVRTTQEPRPQRGRGLARRTSLFPREKAGIDCPRPYRQPERRWYPLSLPRGAGAPSGEGHKVACKLEAWRGRAPLAKLGAWGGSNFDLAQARNLGRPRNSTEHQVRNLGRPRNSTWPKLGTWVDLEIRPGPSSELGSTSKFDRTPSSELGSASNFDRTPSSELGSASNFDLVQARSLGQHRISTERQARNLGQHRNSTWLKLGTLIGIESLAFRAQGGPHLLPGTGFQPVGRHL